MKRLLLFAAMVLAARMASGQKVNTPQNDLSHPDTVIVQAAHPPLLRPSPEKQMSVLEPDLSRVEKMPSVNFYSPGQTVIISVAKSPAH